jgi:trimethylamine:corrinoid methyltransferase-like protein
VSEGERMYRAAIRVWYDAACARVHDATLRVLTEVGVAVSYPEGVRLFRELGAHVDGDRAICRAYADLKRLLLAVSRCFGYGR